MNRLRWPIVQGLALALSVVSLSAAQAQRGVNPWGMSAQLSVQQYRLPLMSPPGLQPPLVLSRTMRSGPAVPRIPPTEPAARISRAPVLARSSEPKAPEHTIPRTGTVIKSHVLIRKTNNYIPVAVDDIFREPDWFSPVSNGNGWFTPWISSAFAFAAVNNQLRLGDKIAIAWSPAVTTHFNGAEYHKSAIIWWSPARRPKDTAPDSEPTPRVRALASQNLAPRQWPTAVPAPQPVAGINIAMVQVLAAARPALVLPQPPARPSVLLTTVPPALQPVRPSITLVFGPPSADPTPSQTSAVPDPATPMSKDQPTPVVAVLPPPVRPALAAPARPTDDLGALVEKMQAPGPDAGISTRTDAETLPPRRKVRPRDLLRPPALPSGAFPVAETIPSGVQQTDGVPLAVLLCQPPAAPPRPDPVYGSE
jgi:hypothetical protein